MTLSFRPANRSQATPLIGLYGLSGTGKTYSALLLARGFAGPEGKVAFIDTERGRGDLYADDIPGGYDILTLEEPFSTQRYIDAINAAGAGGYDIAIVDSISHEWEGDGGILDLATEGEAKTGKSGLHNWKKPKAEHNKFVLSLLRSPIPLICCMRAKFKTRQVRQGGRTEIVRDDHASPIQAEDFIFEMTVHAEVMPDHKIRVSKRSNLRLQEVFKDGDMLSISHGDALRAWAQDGAPKPVARAATAAADPEPDIGFDDGPADPSAPDPFDQANEALAIAAAHSVTELRMAWEALTPDQRKFVGKDGLADFQAKAREAEEANDQEAA